MQSHSPSPDTARPPADIALVGVPSSGITVEGVGITPRDVASLAVTDLTKVPCYDGSGGFAVVLTDPEDLVLLVPSGN